MAGITNRLLQKAAKERIPAHAVFELTPHCNFHCGMCYVRRPEEQPRECDASARGAGTGIRPASFWERVAREGMEAGIFSVLLTGGETFLYPEFETLYKALYDMGLQISVNSNGSTITPKLCRLLRAYPPVAVNITLYGASNAGYARFCGVSDGFDKMKRGAEMLVKNGIRLRFHASLGQDNADDLEQMVKFAQSYGNSLRAVSYLMPPCRRTGQTGEIPGRLTPRRAAYYAVLADYLQMKPENFMRKARQPGEFVELTEDVLAAAGAGEPGEMRCLAGRSSAWIDWQGYLSACGMIEMQRCSLDAYTFAQAWEQIASETGKIRIAAVCANCPNRQGCLSCIAAFYGETGTYNQRPEYLCELRRYTAVYYRMFCEKLAASGYRAASGTASAKNCCLQEEFSGAEDGTVHTPLLQ